MYINTALYLNKLQCQQKATIIYLCWNYFNRETTKKRKIFTENVRLKPVVY